MQILNCTARSVRCYDAGALGDPTVLDRSDAGAGDEVHDYCAANIRARRASVAKAIGEDAVFIAFSSDAGCAARATSTFPFRQEDNLLYLTGVDAPDTTGS